MPADDPVFRRINLAQWLWYGSQIAADEEEKYELLRDIAEHNAMFWNYEGVAQVRQAREQTFKVSDKDFGSMLEQSFGRKADLPDKPSSTTPATSIPAPPPFSEPVRHPMRSELDPSSYLDMDLDEIKFVPFEE